MYAIRSRRAFVLAAALLFSAHVLDATAQSVHRCRLPDGSYAYQDRPCAPEQDAGVHVIKATPAGEVPPGVRAEQDLVAANHAPPPTDFSSFGKPTPTPQPSPQDDKAYRCDHGWKTYYQDTPCPAQTAVGHVETHVEVMRDAWGNFAGTRTWSTQKMEPTTQTEITRKQACEGERAQLDPYEKYTTPNPCDDL